MYILLEFKRKEKKVVHYICIFYYVNTYLSVRILEIIDEIIIKEKY